MEPTLEMLRNALPDAARDVKLNLQAVLAPGGVLSPEQRWGVAVASAIATRHPDLLRAVVAAARAEVDAAVVDDAVAAAALMAMNNVYYRFRHLVGVAAYGEKPARLRMTRMAKPATSRVDFELMSLAVSAVNGCGTCMQAHERVVREGGLGEDHVHDAVRIASVVTSAAVALEAAAALDGGSLAAA